MRSGVEPSVTVESVISVTIAVKRTRDEIARCILADDDGTIGRFRQWMHDNDILPRPGITASPGFWSGYFDASDEQALRKYFGGQS
jgi:hypothetical protein